MTDADQWTPERLKSERTRWLTEVELLDIIAAWQADREARVRAEKIAGEQYIVLKQRAEAAEAALREMQQQHRDAIATVRAGAARMQQARRDAADWRTEPLDGAAEAQREEEAAMASAALKVATGSADELALRLLARKLIAPDQVSSIRAEVAPLFAEIERLQAEIDCGGGSAEPQVLCHKCRKCVDIDLQEAEMQIAGLEQDYRYTTVKDIDRYREEANKLRVENVALRARLELERTTRDTESINEQTALGSAKARVLVLERDLAAAREEIAFLTAELEKGQAYERQAWLDLEAQRGQAKALERDLAAARKEAQEAADLFSKKVQELAAAREEIRMWRDQEARRG